VALTSIQHLLVLTDVIVDGVSRTLVAGPGGQSVTTNGVPITAGVLNTIEVKGHTGANAIAGTYTGTMTFAAGVVPEPASWAMMIGGLGLVGGAMRRRRNNLQLA